MKIRSLIIAGTLALAPATFAAPAAFADVDPIYTSLFSNTAVGGYDPVAYFTDGKPVEGSSDYSTTYQGAEFRFASQENLDTFLADPVKYAPQYGGYCAYAVANGKTAKGNPDNWTIVDGKLYLNLNDNIQKRWDANQANYITDANANWPEISGITPATSTPASAEAPHGS